jgi:hypothetical protein
MTMSYQSYLANQVGTPHYLYPPPKQIRCDDISELPANATAVELEPKVRGIEEIGRFEKIVRIECSMLAVDWVTHLAKLPRLHHLDVHLFRGESLPSLRPLKQLRVLVLYRATKLKTLEFLRGMTQLHSLCLSEVMAATDLTPLATLRNLRELDIDGMLSKAKIVDSLAPLSKLKHLEFLLLACQVRDKTLKPLGKLKSLRRLILGPRYPQSEYRWLFDQLPQLPAINGGLAGQYKRPS